MEEFRTKFNNECNQPYFQHTVKSIVHTDQFMNHLLTQMAMSQKITNQVNSELKTKIPYEVKQVVKPMVKAKTNDFIINTLPPLVTSQIQSQLNNHVHMNDLFKKHSDNLEQKLEAKSRDIFTKVVNEPQFNILSNTHFAEMDRKNESKMTQIHTSLNKLFDDHRNSSLLRIQKVENRQWWTNTIVFCATIAAGSWGGYCYMNKKKD